ncbi:hypothetical protein COCVIDRAFT_103737 [Bipolaris victoriae FI3]|uniref:FAD-binding PCMH-type domain-containing protein n=1 Tax=Bipolaris victoriae (strain FI3) TaxID=930091 RepID=W7EEJ9_BIPV3|nr:hypothetical protein COCVIDRAFT_103737 [Bipolaris victoriae FI3]
MLCRFLWAWTVYTVSLVSATPPSSAHSLREFVASLSPTAQIYFPGSEEYTNATLRWGAGQTPQYDIIVKVATEADVQETIWYANANNKSFHAISGGHAITAYLNNVEHAVGILMRGMKDISITENGDTALVGGGILNGDVLDYLWAHGKQTMTTACACVGYISPILGGGHGWNQGRYGLAADQLVSARMVLANGTAITVSEESNPDLFWAIRGAGHNFGIVTQAEIKIYDREPSLDNWAVDVLSFTHDKMESIVGIVNTWLESPNRSVELEHYIMFYFDPKIDTNNPVVVVFVIYQGTSIPAQYTEPLYALSPATSTSGQTDLAGVSRFTGADRTGTSCEKGLTRSVVPVSATTYDPPSLREVLIIMASLPASLNQTVVLLEGYATNRVGAIPSDSTAYPNREGQLLLSPFMTYERNESLDAEAWEVEGRIRDVMAKGTGEPRKAYVNYARGDETVEELYGPEEWRLERLRGLKREYDPFGKFNFFAPIV